MTLTKVIGYLPPGSSRTIVPPEEGQGGHDQWHPPCHRVVQSGTGGTGREMVRQGAMESERVMVKRGEMERERDGEGERDG